MDFDRSAHHAPYDNDHEHDMYPPQSAYMSRSTSLASGSSFLKKPGLTSEDSLAMPPPLKATAVRELPAEPKEKRKWFQHLISDSWPIRLFLGTVLLETIINLIVQGDIYLQIEKGSSDQRTTTVVSYLALFAFAHVFQLVIAIEAVWQQNTLQFLFLTIFNLLFFIYTIMERIEVLQIKTTANFTGVNANTLLTISHIVVGTAEVVFVALGWQIWKEFGWKVYKFLGADRQIKRIFAHYQIFLSLLRFDMFFCIGFSAQLIAIVLGPQHRDWEYYVTIAALPVGVLLLVGGHFGARYENKWLMFSFMLGCVCAPVYFAFKLFRISDSLNTEGGNSIYAGNSKSLITFAGLSLLFLIVTFLWGCIVMHNFGRGLKEQMERKRAPQGHRRRGTSATLDKHFPMTANPNRMSIE